MGERAELIERLLKRAKEDQGCADNSAVIVDALAGQMKLFDDNDKAGGWNTYAVRMAVDHRNSVKRDTQYASDLLEVADALTAAEAEIGRLTKALEHSEKWREQFDCCMCGSRMDAHNIGSGHSPVSMYDYHQSQLETRATAAEADLDRVKLHLSAWEDSARINKDRAERAEAEVEKLTKALALAILATT